MKTIGVSAPIKTSGLRLILDAVGEFLNIRFEERLFGDDTGIDAWILPEADREILGRIGHSSRPCYTVIRPEDRVPCGNTDIIDFSRQPAVPSAIAGRRIQAEEVIGLSAIPPFLGNMPPLASKEGAPLWVAQEFRGLSHHYVSVPIPELHDPDPLFQHFNGGQFISLLPLIIFLRALTEDPHWEPPPLQACFMLDDPNLHWRRYGFVDFGKIAAEAQRYDYHVSFATIPLDTWYFHPPTASLFRRFRDRISLLIHGNNHTQRELARDYTDGERKHLLLQALRRISRFEARSGVEISRVMAPPHGACNEITLREMANLGFEAACVSRGSLRRDNGQAKWIRTVGMRPVDPIGGLPVFSRFPFSKGCRNNILIAALLHQPVIAMGHHQDLAGGLRRLSDLSSFINSLGTVRWTNMKQISRFHYAQKFEEGIHRVRMLTNRIEVPVSEGTRQLLVERHGSGSGGDKGTPLVWRCAGKDSEWKKQCPNEPIPVLPGQKIEILAELPASTPVEEKIGGSFPLWPVLRKQFTEIRDRLSPALRRASTLFSIPSRPRGATER